MQQTAHPPGTAPPFGNGSSSGEQSTTDQAKDKAQQAAGQAQEKVQQGAEQAKSRIRSEVDSRSTQAGEQVKSTAGDLRSVGDTLREQGKEQPAKIADQAAERVERVGTYLQDTNGEQLLHDLEDAARQRPWAVVAAGLAAGFAASRFLKASSSDRYRTRTGTSSGSGHFGSSAGAGTAGDRFSTPAPTAHPTTPIAPGTPKAPIVPAPSGGSPGTAGPGGL